MQSIIANGYLAIPEQDNEQLLTALRTAWAKELSLDKNVSFYDDALDALFFLELLRFSDFRYLIS